MAVRLSAVAGKCNKEVANKASHFSVLKTGGKAKHVKPPHALSPQEVKVCASAKANASKAGATDPDATHDTGAALSEQPIVSQGDSGAVATA
jgi:hypothetical protein